MNYQTIIVGAGPAGLQLGYFLEKGGYNYVILEKADSAASFFQSYPHSGKLISINKPNTGRSDPEFNLRHDWNSLLEEGPMRFTDYSDEYYPDRTDLVEYMNDYAKRNKLNIKYNTTVHSVKKGYVLDTSNGVYMCDKLVMATGLSAPIYPNLIDNSVRRPKHYGEYEPGYFKKEENLELFRNKSVLFIGNGNAAYELGNLLTPYCSTVIIRGRKPKEWALSSHYTGDLRSIYLPFFDTFLLKSLNALDHLNVKTIIDQKTETSKYLISHLCSDECSIKHPAFRDSIDGFDFIIYCTGWKFNTSVFDFPVNTARNEKYPHISEKYESSNNPGLFFIGSLMHSHDFKMSSGGFIHGFRYLIKYFYQLHYSKKFSVCTLKDETLLTSHIVKRINTNSGLYQMYGQMCDIIWYNKKEDSFLYYENMTTMSLDSELFPNGDYVYYILTFEYGGLITNIPQLGEKVSRPGKECFSTLLHPVMRIYDGKKTFIDEVHFDEDLLANFTNTAKYNDKFLRTIKMFL
jgi:thioredoxin reductase